MSPTSASGEHGPEGSILPRQHVGSISRAAATYKRKKTTAACQVCRARRTKCDNGRPCSYCWKNGHECLSSTSDAPHWDPATMHILERIDALENQLTGVSRSITAVQGQSLDAASPASVRSGPLLTALSPESLHPQNLEAVLQWVPLQQLENVHEIVEASSRARLLPKACDHTRPRSPDLEYVSCRRLIDAFFAYIHPKNPVLHETEIRAAVKKAAFDGFRWNADDALLLLLLAIGTLAIPFVDERHHVSNPDLEYAQALYIASQKRFGPHTDAGYLVQAKYFFYSGVYLMSMLRPFEAWRTFLQALAVCQGFSALAPSQPHTPLDRGRLEESLYWSCWKSEREVRSELGLPDFGTTGSEHPHMYPSLPQGCEDDTLRAWYFYLAEISLWRLETSAKNDIAEVVARERDADLDKLAAIVHQLHEPLKSWVSSLPPILSLGDANEGPEACVLRFVLQGRLTYNHELLTWPFLHAAVNSCGPLSAPAQQLAVEAIHHHLDRLRTNKPGFYHRHHGTWLMMRSSARSACIILAARLASTMSNHLPTSWSEVVWETIEMLEYWNGSGGGMEAVTAFLRRETARFM